MCPCYPHTPTAFINPVVRDSKERGRKLENILHQYTELVKPAFEEFTLPVCEGGGGGRRDEGVEEMQIRVCGCVCVCVCVGVCAFAYVYLC